MDHCSGQRCTQATLPYMWPSFGYFTTVIFSCANPTTIANFRSFFFIVFLSRDVTTGKILVQPLRWWGRICPPGWNRVKASENLGATAVPPVAPAVTSL